MITNISQPSVTSSCCFFRPSNTPRPKVSSFTIEKNDNEKKQILTFKKLEKERFTFCEREISSQTTH